MRGILVVFCNVGPAELYWLDCILQFVRDIQDAATFGAEQPLMAIRSECIDMALPDIKGEYAQALDSINYVDAIVSAADLTDFFNGERDNPKGIGRS